MTTVNFFGPQTRILTSTGVRGIQDLLEGDAIVSWDNRKRTTTISEIKNLFVSDSVQLGGVLTGKSELLLTQDSTSIVTGGLFPAIKAIRKVGFFSHVKTIHASNGKLKLKGERLELTFMEGWVVPGAIAITTIPENQSFFANRILVFAQRLEI